MASVVFNSYNSVVSSATRRLQPSEYVATRSLGPIKSTKVLSYTRFANDLLHHSRKPEPKMLTPKKVDDYHPWSSISHATRTTGS